VSAAPIVAAPTARLGERPGDGLGHNGGWAMSLRNEWRTTKADMDALAKTLKAAIERKSSSCARRRRSSLDSDPCMKLLKQYQRELGHRAMRRVSNPAVPR
jgi:hypothetical protein